jgi:hypothetical protein
MYPVKKKFKSQPIAGKLMLMLFWDSQGPILQHYQEWDVIINNVCLSEMLHDKLKLAIWSKRQRQLSQGVVA